MTILTWNERQLFFVYSEIGGLVKPVLSFNSIGNMRGRKIPFAQTLQYAYELADALKYCHDDAIPGEDDVKLLSIPLVLLLFGCCWHNQAQPLLMQAFVHISLKTERHSLCIAGYHVIHRDIKPDNIGGWVLLLCTLEFMKPSLFV